MIYRILVTGSRTWTDRDTIRRALDAEVRHAWALGFIAVVVHGACPRGADLIADQYAIDNHIPVERHPAEWSSGRGAGHRRNALMVKIGARVCLAFIRNESPGATSCARLAEDAGIYTRRWLA